MSSTDKRAQAKSAYDPNTGNKSGREVNAPTPGTPETSAPVHSASPTALSPEGPEAEARWETRQIETGSGRSLTLLITPDNSNPRRAAAGLPYLYHYLPQTPRLAIDRAGQPVFSLTLILTRQPATGEQDIQPLVERSSLAMTLTFDLPGELLKALTASTQAEYQPLFTRHTVFSFEAEAAMDGKISEQASGNSSWAPISAQLGRDDTLKLLSAIGGGRSGLKVNGQVTYRSAPSAGNSLVMGGDWGQVYNFLQTKTGPGGGIDYAGLREAFTKMIQSGLLSARLEGSSADERAIQDPEIFWRPFLRVATIILRRLNLDLALDDPINRYQLREQPPAGMELEVHYTAAPSAGRDQYIELSAPLEDILAGAFAGLDLDAFIHLVCPGGPKGEIGPAPRQVRMNRSRDRAGPRPARLAAIGGIAGSLTLALQPTAQEHPLAHALLVSDAVHTTAIATPNHHLWAVDDLLIGSAGSWFGHHPAGVLSLPVVADSSAALWPDRLNNQRFWYPPTFEPVTPALNASPTDSPFLFSFSTSGHGLELETGLNGKVRFTLKKGMSAETQAAIQAKGNPQADPVVLTNLSVALELPFRDQNGKTIRESFPAKVEQNGDTLVVTLDLIDNWVRLLYGALAFAGFQAEPTRLSISYTYQAYVPIDPNRLQLLYGGKIAALAVIHKTEDLAGQGRRPYLDARDGSIHLMNSVLRLTRETPANKAPDASNGSSEAPPASSSSKNRKKSAAARSEPTETPSMTIWEVAAARAALDFQSLNRPRPPLTLVASNLPITAHNNLVVQPALHVNPSILDPEPEIKYAQQSLGVTRQAEVLYPCQDFGALYVQESPEELQTVACMDALKLGQTEYHQYRQLTDSDLFSPFYSVYRSLQMPERFLVLPAAYRITRFGPDDGERAYRPAIFLYSTIDAEDLENSSIVITSTLQPDIPAYSRRELVEKLKTRFHRPPLIEYATEIESQVRYEWSIPTGGPHPVETQVAKLWDSFQVGMTTDIIGVSQLQALLEGGAVSAQVIFSLPDGSQLQSSLLPDLRQISGPWANGPLEVHQQGNDVTLTNQIETGVNITDLNTYQSGGGVQVIQVDRLLAQGEAWTGSVPASTKEAYPVYSLQSSGPVALPEIRSFIEDIHTNIIFLSQASFANHNLKKLDITARIVDLAGTYTAAISDEGTPAAIDIILPLTAFLANPTLQFQVTRTDAAGQASRTPWLDWPLASKGVVVGLTWELIESVE